MKLRAAERLWTVAALVGILWLYHWTLGSVSGLAPASATIADNDYYNHLVAGFLHGHLYLDTPVPEALKALRDPYDPTQNRGIGLIDSSYYHGHYYLYFGATPAITLLLPYRVATGLYLPTPRAILAFCWVGFLASTAVWLALRRRYYPQSPTWTAPIGVLLLGVGPLAGVMLRRPFFWELAVAGGYAFAMLAVAALYRALHAERRLAGWMAIAGICLGLAAASRPTYLFAAPILLVPLLVPAQCRFFSKRWWGMACAGGAGFCAVFAAMLAYNYGRYGNPLEFGHNYLLSVAYESKVRMFDLGHLWFNLRMYYFLPGQWSWHAPFFAPKPVPQSEWPASFYTVDDVFGLIPVFPIALLALVTPLAIMARKGADRARFGATLAVLVLLFVTVGTVVLLYVATIPRYAVDFQPAFILLAAIGLLFVTDWTTATGRIRTWHSVICTAAIVSLVTGTAAVFGVGQALIHGYPTTVARLDSLTSRAEAFVDRVRGKHFGPVELTLRFPASPKSQCETLLTSGDPTHPDRVLIEYLAPGHIRLGFQANDSSRQWSHTLEVDPTATHRVRVDLGSFYPSIEHRYFTAVSYDQASRIRHHAEIVLDEKIVLQSLAPFAASRNGAPTQVDRSFTGQVSKLVAVVQPADQATPECPGNLLLRFSTPQNASGRRLPLISSGRAGAADLLFLEFIDANHARLGFDHWGAPLIWSPPFALDENQPHRIEIRQVETGWSAPKAGPRLLVAWADSHLVWYQHAEMFPCSPDEIHVGRTTIGQTTAEGSFPGLSVSAASTDIARHSGSLLLRVILPPPVKGAWQPLLSVGPPGAADVLSIYYIDHNIIQLRLDHVGTSMMTTSAITTDSGQGHDLEVELPSFTSDHYGKTTFGSIVLRWDGIEVLNTHGESYGFTQDQFILGRNPTHSFMDDLFFRGCFVQTDWLYR